MPWRPPSDKTRRKGSFADGVFSIAATLLIIDVSVGACRGRAGSLHDHHHHWPASAVYAVSFLTTGVMWLYTAATLVAFWSPKASVTLFAAIAVFYVLESSLFGRSA